MSATEVPGPTYRIAEVARLTGFAPTALRFYEQAGVLAPPARTPAGYRVYDDRAVERLQLVARAKELGCTLEEIAGLVEAWDADDCGPVKHRLRSLVHAKATEVRRHLAEQAAFAAQLDATAEVLAGRPVDGPCDDRCGCTTVAADGGGAGADAGAAPIACSLSAGDVRARVEEWAAVLADVVAREPIRDGVRLVFAGPAALREVARLAVAERACCPFFDFAMTIDGRGAALEVTAPAEGRVLLESVFGAAP